MNNVLYLQKWIFRKTKAQKYRPNGPTSRTNLTSQAKSSHAISYCFKSFNQTYFLSQIESDKNIYLN